MLWLTGLRLYRSSFEKLAAPGLPFGVCDDHRATGGTLCLSDDPSRSSSCCSTLAGTLLGGADSEIPTPLQEFTASGSVSRLEYTGH